MDSVQIFTVSGITATALLGVYNLFINHKSQRKYQRELIFNKQFELFMQFQSLFTDLENEISSVNMGFSNYDKTKESIFRISQAIGTLIGKNELIIPDALFFKLNNFSSYCFAISTLTFKEPLKIDKVKKGEFMDKSVSLLEDLRDYIGVEHMSEENRKLVKGRIFKD